MADKVQFGDQLVEPEEKTRRVGSVFSSVARRYDVMNDLMSGGLHRLWKDRFVRAVKPRRGEAILDMAGGTGDVAFRIARAGGDRTRVTVLDINADMLQVGRDRAAKARLTDRVEFVEANAEELPFEASRYDAYTVAFGIRNVPRIQVALTEAYRVLRRGGHFLCLEFSPDVLPLLDRVYETYSFKVIPWIGERVTGDRESYQYLVESIRKFPGAAAFEGQLRAAGFRQTQVVPLSGGIVAIHSGWKL